MARRTQLLENVRVDLNISPELERLMAHNAEIIPNSEKFGFRRVTKEGSKQVKAKIRSLGLKQSGALAKSVRGSTTNRKSFIGTKMWYAHFLEDGTAPHLIKPKKKWNKKFLRIPIDGKIIKTKTAFHPGVRAYKFLEGTFDNMQSSGQVESLFAMGVNEAIEKVQNGS